MENKKSIVYFSSNISGEELEKMVEKLDFKPTGKVAIKVHSGEKGNQNFIKPEFYKELVMMALLLNVILLMMVKEILVKSIQSY